MKKIAQEYKEGSSIQDLSIKYNISDNQVRSFLKTQINWYDRSVSDLTQEEQVEILNKYKNEISVVEISDMYKVPAPSIIKLLRGLGVERVYHKGRKFELLKQTPFNSKQQQFIVGTLLGDGCIRKSGNLPRLCIVHSKKFEQYFHWKIAQLDGFFNLWREQEHPRKKSTLLYSETLQHSGLTKFYDMFYVNGQKIVPKCLDQYMTPYCLSVWFLDDGTLNSKTNHRIHTNGFNYNGQLELKDLLKRCFDLNCNIVTRKDGQYILSFKRVETVKLSKIIEPHVIPRMQYKLRLSLNCSSTTTCQTPEETGDDIV